MSYTLSAHAQLSFTSCSPFSKVWVWTSPFQPMVTSDNWEDASRELNPLPMGHLLDGSFPTFFGASRPPVHHPSSGRRHPPGRVGRGHPGTMKGCVEKGTPAPSIPGLRAYLAVIFEQTNK